MMLGWILSGLSITGAILNARMIRAGFVFWIIANIGWIVFGIKEEIYSQIPIWIVFTVISIYGFVFWEKPQSKEG